MTPFLLHHLLHYRACQTPDQTAVVCQDESITYADLDAMSNQLAHTLQHYGIQKGDRVGLYLDKSLAAIVGIFGILKAGAAYVPIDPLAPAQRAALIMENCQMRGLISTSTRMKKMAAALPEDWCVQQLILADLEENTPTDIAAGNARLIPWLRVQESATEPLDVPTLIENDLAYILYTSGSTGIPKGVMVSHRAALTFVNWATDYFQIQATDRLSNHAPLHFDLSIFDIFASIQAGATVVLIPASLSVFPRMLADLIAAQRISIWYSVPSILIRLIQHGELTRHDFAALRQILFAGEVFPIKYLRSLQEQIPHPAYFNLYGPTETNVCTVYAVGSIPADRVAPLPIGQACANSDVFALNEQGALICGEEEGELMVRGPSLMAGYWGLPEQSMAVLVPHPDPQMSHAQVYRTGDLVKRDADGHYLFLGRRDAMIKSRGYRIELGEIESALYRHPDVVETAALAIPDEENGHLIQAVAVLQNEQAMTEGELKRFCGQHIPSYMVPQSIDFCASLPKTSTGKVDRKRLTQERTFSSLIK